MILDVIGIWIAAFLTLAILSFVFGDNPIYKFAEHIFVGISAGFGVILALNQAIWPSIQMGLDPSQHVFIRTMTVVAILLGILTLIRLEIFTYIVPSLVWLSRIPIAFVVGIGSGISIVASIQGFIFPQTLATFLPVLSPEYMIDLSSPLNFLTSLLFTIGPLVILLGVISTLVYFYFSTEQRGVLLGIAKLGIIIMMITFGASFGYTIMARFSLLISRFYFLLSDWLNIIR
ncbi:MAG: hypothetical protein N2504_05780 [candidate division WOR-3 bacterium]|nr:hypothetical protein [candidate division WOR-3 bacterium]MCX7948080.1 hypothetical protein [candidate division WOR-3 bacterium]MDW8150982.1 hypothetical protein [candidate division WOR-3 bacterium]